VSLRRKRCWLLSMKPIFSVSKGTAWWQLLIRHLAPAAMDEVVEAHMGPHRARTTSLRALTRMLEDEVDDYALDEVQGIPHTD
jgi:hypothetical protein